MPLFALGISQALVFYCMSWEVTKRETKKIALLFCGDVVLTMMFAGETVIKAAETVEHSVMALGNGKPAEIGENLYSRQLAVYGRETMRRLFASNILVSGRQGLGAEIERECLLDS